MDPIVARYRGAGQSALLPVIQQTQATYGYLPRPAVELISKALRVPVARIYGVVTFYAAFSLVPRGKHTIKVCLGTACHLKGGPRLVQVLARELGLPEDGGTTEDLSFTVETVNCLGACALAPVMVVDGKYIPKASPERLPRLLKSYREK